MAIGAALARGEASVAFVAQRYGFANAGRFAAAYARRFGEFPSETRRRSAPCPGDGVVTRPK